VEQIVDASAFGKRLLQADPGSNPSGPSGTTALIAMDEFSGATWIPLGPSGFAASGATYYVVGGVLQSLT